MKHLATLLIAVAALAACGKKADVAPVATADAQASAVAAPDLAQKLAAAYPKIRCALASNQHNQPGLYKDAGFADSIAFFKAFDAEAAAHPDWARQVTGEALLHPCIDPAAATTPTSADKAADAAGEPTPQPSEGP